ncbi:MAG TPA: redoxin domain-containing protein [Candidatus Dormibacteraeota bacterium]|nr:redoxin domain-containing protein [Candidatus Dormibacteraeota bacterium]
MLLRPGDPAPDFALPAVNREGQVSLDDYRGRSPVLVALFRGLHCPFCRRQLVQLGTTQDKLKAMGVETMAVVNTPLERARLYFKYRPARVLLAADPEAATHRAFRVPAGTLVQNESEASWSRGTVTMGQMQAARINPTGELPEPQNPFVAMETLNKRDGFEVTEVDQQIAATHGMQLGGHFLIGRDGMVRWLQIEGLERVEDLSKFPSDEEIVAAARAL